MKNGKILNVNGKKRPLKVYIADLEYDSVYTIVTVPLNAGYFAAYLDDKHGSEVDISVFKYPKKLDKAIDEDPPDMLCLSHYSWNARLGMLFAEKVKRINPKIITVMGGPNIRRRPDGIHAFLKKNRAMDYYIMDYGQATEEYLSELVGELLSGNEHPHPTCCATIIDGKFYFDNHEDWRKKDKRLHLPSPYLSGHLDEFLKDHRLIPLVETNRGCPYECVFCTFGDFTLTKLRLKSIELVYEEMQYIVDNSAGQQKWILVDANFGIHKRDNEIAKKIRELKDTTGLPYEVLYWDAKNSNMRRTMEIYDVHGAQNRPLIAVQSTDPKVTHESGRGKLNDDVVKEKVKYFKDKKIETKTDIILGLPGETAASHFNTLAKCFDYGFDWFVPKELRLMPGIEYELDHSREKYKIKSKFRPIFGAYGHYDNRFVFELEESVRETKDMTYDEMSDFKLHHILITYAWSGRVFRPLLKLAQSKGINPMTVFDQLSRSRDPIVKNTFDQIKADIRSEYFDTAEEIVTYYNKFENKQKLINQFMKLTYLYCSRIHEDKKLLKSIEDEIIMIIVKELKAKNSYDPRTFDDMVRLTEHLTSYTLLDKEFYRYDKYYGRNVSLVTGIDDLNKSEYIDVEIYRPEDVVSFCTNELKFKEGKEGVSKYSHINITRFLERKGLEHFVNKIRLVGKEVAFAN